MPQEILLDCQAEVKQLFLIKTRYQKTFKLKYESIFSTSKTIVIHIRRTDFLNWGGQNHALPIEYYHQALAMIPDVAEYQILVCSDDIHWAKINLPLQSGTLYVFNDEITDFQLFTHADVVIVANSSFSIYGAWLNAKPYKQIFQPSVIYEGKKSPCSLLGISENWIVVDIAFEPAIT